MAYKNVLIKLTLSDESVYLKLLSLSGKKILQDKDYQKLIPAIIEEFYSNNKGKLIKW